jgi:hypothetical protein
VLLRLLLPHSAASCLSCRDGCSQLGQHAVDLQHVGLQLLQHSTSRRRQLLHSVQHGGQARLCCVCCCLVQLTLRVVKQARQQLLELNVL